MDSIHRGLELHKVCFSYPSSKQLLDDVSVQIRPGEICCLLGGSGCGKTTLLRVIAGLERAQSGSVIIDGVDYASAAMLDQPRPVSLMFQDYALFPNMSAIKNVMFAMRHVRRRERRSIATKMLEEVGLVDKLTASPSKLSGGEQQRVALARALVVEPQLMLLDEPLSNLDAELRQSIREQMKQSLKRANVATLMVTHSVEEAELLADQVIRI